MSTPAILIVVKPSATPLIILLINERYKIMGAHGLCDLMISPAITRPSSTFITSENS
jgi:hypothetical protein